MDFIAETVTVQEIDVLLAVIQWLGKRIHRTERYGVSFSLSGGMEPYRSRVLGCIGAAGFIPGDEHRGWSDLTVFSDDPQELPEEWHVECKGFGADIDPRTRRNNFGRALASVVSYYFEPEEGEVYLGLALPASPHYMRELQRRVKKDLRKRLNLWILLYIPSFQDIYPVAPDDDYPGANS